MFESFTIEQINSLSPTELETLRYINGHKKEVIDMSIQDLSKSVFVSTATIIRLCKKLDFEGYSNLKYFIKQKLSEEGESDNSQSVEPSLKEIINEELSDIVKTASALNEDMVKEIVGLMKQDYRMHFFAKGLTNTVFDYAVKHLLSLSKYAVKYDDTHISYAQANRMNQHDLVFLASLSGETEQVIRVAQIAKSRNAKVITFTASLASTLSKIGDYNILLVNNAKSSLEVDTKSRCQLMFILNILVKMCAVNFQ